MNRIDQLFQQKSKNILSVYFTAGYPTLNSTTEIILQLEKSGADMIEIGIPFSDPMADGPVIQQSSEQALKNGMSLELLLKQLKDIRKHTQIPLLLMGYLNPIYRYGIDRFIEDTSAIGIDGCIIPDLPLEIYKGQYQKAFKKGKLKNVFLVTPVTASSRIKQIDALENGFIYFVSSAATTGVQKGIEQDKKAYFQRIQNLNLKNPKLIGFGIGDAESFNTACEYAQGAIIGSAFIKALEKENSLAQNIQHFTQNILQL